MNADIINQLSIEIFEQNKAVGWWDDLNRCPYQTLQLVNTEIAEATEGDRKGLMDDHLPHRLMAEVELADTMIRALDIAGRYGWEFEPNLAIDAGWVLGKFVRMITHGETLAVKHLGLTGINCLLAAKSWGGEGLDVDGNVYLAKVPEYDYLVEMCLDVADRHGYDLEGAIREKLAYNRQRADHKRENRAQVGGKAY